MDTSQPIFVTGGTGFLGGTLIQRLSAEGYRVRALARDPARATFIRDLRGLELVQGDLTQTENLYRVLAGCGTVFHVAAAITGPLRTQQATNIEGTRHLVRAAADAGVRRFVHVSTVAVYGYSRQGIIRESDPMTPGDEPYSSTKAEAERIIGQVAGARHLPYSIIRPAMIYGPRSGMWTEKAFRLASLPVIPWVGDGSGNAYPIYVEDVVDLMLVLAEHPAAVGEIFNCAPDPSPTWRDFLGAYAHLTGREPSWLRLPFNLVHPIVRLLSRLAPAQTPLKEAANVIQMTQRQTTHSMAKARDLLGWSPQVELAEGIQRSGSWLRETGKL
jgi:nucleoside-diphosphate-sugar epimerase